MEETQNASGRQLTTQLHTLPTLRLSQPTDMVFNHQFTKSLTISDFTTSLLTCENAQRNGT
jgi:hypothetical protein